VLPDSPVIPLATAELQRLGIESQAEQMFAEIGAAVGSKEEMTRVCFRYLRLDPKSALFQYLDRRTGQKTPKPL
jgi:hypothetical protein